MPKEKIPNRYFGKYTRTLVCKNSHDHNLNCWEDGDPLDDSFVHVGWHKDLMQVEVAILKESDDPEVLEGRWHSQMDRAGVNHLIRTLRKARDSAFGRDE